MGGEICTAAIFPGDSVSRHFAKDSNYYKSCLSQEIMEHVENGVLP